MHSSSHRYEAVCLSIVQLAHSICGIVESFPFQRRPQCKDPLYPAPVSRRYAIPNASSAVIRQISKIPCEDKHQILPFHYEIRYLVVVLSYPVCLSKHSSQFLAVACSQEAPRTNNLYRRTYRRGIRYRKAWARSSTACPRVHPDQQYRRG
jgi:hypothetical protein